MRGRIIKLDEDELLEAASSGLLVVGPLPYQFQDSLGTPSAAVRRRGAAWRSAGV